MSDEDESLDQAVRDAYALVSKRNAAEYDGVYGQPPSWVPEWAVQNFYHIRNRMLDVRQYSHDELLELSKQYRDVFYDSNAENAPVHLKFHWPVVYPNGNNVDLYCFQDEIGFIAWLKWCVDHGPEDGLKILGGGFAPTGKKFRSGGATKKGREYEPTQSIRNICESIDSYKFNDVLLVLASEPEYLGIDIQEVDDWKEKVYYRLVDPPFTEKFITYKRLKNILAEIKP